MAPIDELLLEMAKNLGYEGPYQGIAKYQNMVRGGSLARGDSIVLFERSAGIVTPIKYTVLSLSQISKFGKKSNPKIVLGVREWFAEKRNH